MRIRAIHSVAILSALLAHAPIQAQQLAQGGGVEISVWRVVFSFLFCITLAAGAIFALRRKLPTSTLFKRVGADRLKLVEQISLGPQRGIYLIELDGKEYLALFSQQGASLTPTGGAPVVTGTDE
jgi:flagellar biogenesis protein FliO